MKFAYADPPYLGQGKKLYQRPEWDRLDMHAAFIDALDSRYPDGWALSASSPSLRAILPLCPPDVRVASWVKPFAVFKPNVNPAYAWEPVIFRGGRSNLLNNSTRSFGCLRRDAAQKRKRRRRPHIVNYWSLDSDTE